MRTPGAYSTSRPQTDIRQQAWNSIRVFKVFTTAQVASTARIGKSNLRKYLGSLHRAGYIVISRPKQNGKSQGHTIYRLARDTGPKHPLPRRDGTGVYDQNQDVLYPFAGEAETQDDRRKLAGNAS